MHCHLIIGCVLCFASCTRLWVFVVSTAIIPSFDRLVLLFYPRVVGYTAKNNTHEVCNSVD